jgi:hypothetical protein
MRKNGLYLVSTKPVKKRYDMFYVFCCDGSIFEYKLDEIKIMRDEEWVEITRNDGTIMESFYNSNIMRVKFMKSNAKLVPNDITPITPITPLKPVA